MTVTETQPAEVGGNPPSSTYEGTGKLAEALAAVQLHLPAIRKAETGKVSGKNKDGEFFSYEYSYAGLGAVSAAIMPLLGENGLAFTSWPTRTTQGLVLRYYLLHESGQRLDGEYPLPSNGTPQQLGSAITYARRYCLCAVTGVAPDDDDDAAAADGANAERRAEVQARAAEQTAQEQAAYASERQHGLDAVRGAWATQYGEFDGVKAEEMYKAWSKGGTVEGATPAQLRAFAGMILAQPKADAGSEPAATSDQQPEQEAQPSGRGKMTVKQRGQLFVLLGQIGLTAKTDQLSWINKQLSREYESRTEITFEDAGVLIDALMKDGVTVLPESQGGSQ